MRTLSIHVAVVLAGVAAMLGVPDPAAAVANGPASPGLAPAAITTAGVAVFDRQTSTFTEQRNVNVQFRSASVVKLLLALDFLWNRGPGYDIPAADRTRLDAMLRSSDDAAASYYWQSLGSAQVVTRMVARLGLRDTAGPPAGYPTYWGYTALSAADTITIYRYLLDAAPAPVRDYIMGNLRQATRCGTDRYDQYFGIPSAFARPWTIKQGWSGFPASPRNPCVVSGATAAGPSTQAVDLVSEALHTTGTVGPSDRSIVAVFTLHPDGTSFPAAFTALTDLTRSLNVPGSTLVPAPKWFGTWGSGVRVRATPSTTSTVLATIPAGVEVLVRCQVRGQEVSVPPYRNDWWAFLPAYGGYMTNIYISSPENKLPGVPDC